MGFCTHQSTSSLARKDFRRSLVLGWGLRLRIGGGWQQAAGSIGKGRKDPGWAVGLATPPPSMGDACTEKTHWGSKEKVL